MFEETLMMDAVDVELPRPRYTKVARIYDAVQRAAGKDYQHEAQQIHAIIQHYKRTAEETSLLDVACGTGAHLEQLRTWYAVEGLDLNGDMLDVARKRLPGVKLHWANLIDFNLNVQFSAVMCLGGAIGYAKTFDNLRSSVQAMARHLLPGGVLVLEPWFTPEAYRDNEPHAVYVDEPELKLARLYMNERRGNISVLKMHYLLTASETIEHFVDLHELALFTNQEYCAALYGASLELAHIPEGLTGKGLYVGVKPVT